MEHRKQRRVLRTEKQASESICPLLSVASQEPRPCVGSACMFWRWDWSAAETKSSEPAGLCGLISWRVKPSRCYFSGRVAPRATAGRQDGARRRYMTSTRPCSLTATQRVVRQLNARQVRENEFRARCPVHQGKSDTSLSIKNAGDRVLIRCHSGCSLQDVLSALGMKSAAELYDNVRPDTQAQREAERQARIRRGLEVWAEQRLVMICTVLRSAEYCVSDSAQALKQYEDGKLPRDSEAEAEWWDILGRAIRIRSDLEREFEILNGSDLQAKYDLFRSLK
jgi:hypothetical protein